MSGVRAGVLTIVMTLATDARIGETTVALMVPVGTPGVGAACLERPNGRIGVEVRRCGRGPRERPFVGSRFSA